MKRGTPLTARDDFQILEVAVEPSGVPVEFDPIDRVTVASALPLHRDIRPPRHAGTVPVSYRSVVDLPPLPSSVCSQVFGGKFNFSELQDKPRHNFDSFWQSLLTVFQVIVLGADHPSCL